MANWKDKLNGDPVPWLLENDRSQPAVRYYALRDILGRDENDKEVKAAKAAIMTSGPVPLILAAQHPEGYWGKPGAGYFPMYTGTVWAVIFLAQLSTSIEMDKRIATACAYVLDHSLTKYGHFTTKGSPSSTLMCLQGNLCWSLLELGCTDTRLGKAFDLMARIVTGEGIAPVTDKAALLRYYAGDLCGPEYACGGTYRKPCAWGAIKVLLAFGRLPFEKRTYLMNRAIKIGVDFLFSKDPATADYPIGYSSKPTGKPSSNWWKFGFPNFYVSDVLQNVEVLTRLGYGKDPRLANALQLIRDKQNNQGRWQMEHNYEGKTWVDIEKKGQPSKWVTLRALRVLKAVYPEKG
jgi:hypothetical protein